MKIICFIDSLGSGGAQRQLVELAKGFKQKGHEVWFLTYHEINFFKSELDDQAITVTTIKESNYFLRLLKVRSFIRQSKPDSVVAFLQGPSFMATLAGFPYRKWKLIVGERSANPNILKSKKLRMYRWFHLFADYVVANSNANLSLVKKINPLLNSNRLRVIYNIANSPEKLIRRNVFDRVSEKTKIVVAASHRPVKNVDGLIQALNQIPSHYLEKIEIDWYGNPEDQKYSAEMREKIKKYNLCKVLRLKPLEKNIFQKYVEADFVGLFSHYEGFPNTICEAMSLGVPVVVSEVSDISLFVKDGQSGITCNSKDIASIKDALLRTVDSTPQDRFFMGEMNRTVAEEHFSKEVIVSRYLNLLSNGA